MGTEGNATPEQRRRWWETTWGAALAAGDAQSAARAQAIRDRLERHHAMVARTNMLAAMTEEERATFWEQEGADAAAASAAQQAAQGQRDRLLRWQQWLADHPHTVDIHGNPRNHRADTPAEWFT